MKNYSINFATNTITVSKSFQMKASRIGTEAFETMMALRKLNMRIVIKETPARKSGNRLTYNKIINYLSTFEDAEARLADFETVRTTSKVQGNPYQYVIDWFDDTYAIRGKKPELTKDHKIVALAKKQETQDKKEDAA